MRPSPRNLSTLPPTIRSLLAARRAAPSTSSSSESPSQESQQIEVNGWIKSVRGHRNVSFVELNDGSTSESLQAVLKGKGKAEGLGVGTSLSLKGRLEKSKGKGQDLELVINQAQVAGHCDAQLYPIQKKSLPPAVLRENAHLRFRTTQTAAVMRIRDALVRDWHDWFEENEFVHIQTPLLTASDCEGAGEVFTLKDHPAPTAPTSPQPFFDHPVHLTVSGQLHLEAPTHSLSRTYTLSPAFRAEPSLTSRHLSEFYMMEGEVAWVESLDGLLDVVEDGVRSVVSKILGQSKRGERLRRDLEAVSHSIQESEGDEATLEERLEDPLARLRHIVAQPFTRITYSSALELIATLHTKSPDVVSPAPPWGEGISTEHEKLLAEHFNGPLFVTRYPKSLKPFYMLPTSTSSQSDQQTVECFDLLFPSWGEMAGGSLREYRLDHLTRAISDAGMKPEEYEWYLDLRRYGTVPHGGWGMGWDRWVGWVTGLGNVRDVVPYPRWKGHCKY
ncbi:asparagine-tRNA ligase [Cryptococcus amylolentus CBS 6039]|uniref:asparagine--tRNA ligase n=2 Tax=Cryptococcus amylolentus TaxID=104669 RepID=A0A1E3I1T8_9TREE|nr:asparagine-tRNA ligase [Cryptococcus amylolentus CBS 6039]ODN81801.1 asparagine-tRNA ligase [Cryptococcus amylolentus CBS 6039]ODO10023.1 asparagine-tRNA ligase [Cryptococcus amylolentus CBS 6273]